MDSINLLIAKPWKDLLRFVVIKSKFYPCGVYVVDENSDSRAASNVRLWNSRCGTVEGSNDSSIR